MSITKKLLLKSGYTAAVINAPTTFAIPIADLPEGVNLVQTPDGSLDFALLFAHSQAELKEFAPKTVGYLRDNSVFWAAYPKKSSKIKSDISRDTGWDVLQAEGYQGVSLVSLDDTWSAMRFRKK